MQRFPDHSAQPSEELVTCGNYRRTGASLRLPISASGQLRPYATEVQISPIRTFDRSERVPAVTWMAGHPFSGHVQVSRLCSRAVLFARVTSQLQRSDS